MLSYGTGGYGQGWGTGSYSGGGGILSPAEQIAYDQRMDEISRQMQQNRLDISNNQEARNIDMVRATPSSVLKNDFFMTPAWQLYYGTQDPNIDDPTARFYADPGYQFTQEEGVRQLLRNHAAKGLLESGRSIRDVLGYTTNLADQNYQRFRGQEMGLYSDYQNRLQGLMGMGPSVSGAQNAMQLGGSLAGLFANQGVFGGSGMLNTAAAQAGNTMNAGVINAQIAAANAAGGGGGGGLF